MLRKSVLVVLLGLIVVSGVVVAQRYGGRFYRRRSIPTRDEFPTWENDPDFQSEVFTFARIRYTPHDFRGWDGDYPEADWNLSYRLPEDENNYSGFGENEAAA